MSAKEITTIRTEISSLTAAIAKTNDTVAQTNAAVAETRAAVATMSKQLSELATAFTSTFGSVGDPTQISSNFELLVKLPPIIDDLNLRCSALEGNSNIVNHLQTTVSENHVAILIRLDKIDEINAQRITPIDLIAFKNLEKEVKDVHAEILALHHTSHPTFTSVISSLDRSLSLFIPQLRTQHETTLSVIENTVNKVSPPTDQSFTAFMDTYNNWLVYRENGGHKSFFSLLLKSPNVLAIYRKKAAKTRHGYDFTPDLMDDTEMFAAIFQDVFFPEGITVDAYKQLLLSKRMYGTFSLQKASLFSFHVYTITTNLRAHLPDHLIAACWKEVAHSVADTDFRYSLLTQNPSSFDHFWTTIEDRSKLMFESTRSRNQFQHQYQSDSLESTPTTTSQSFSQNSTRFSNNQRERQHSPISNYSRDTPHTSDRQHRRTNLVHSRELSIDRDPPTRFCYPCSNNGTDDYDCLHPPSDCPLRRQRRSNVIYNNPHSSDEESV